MINLDSGADHLCIFSLVLFNLFVLLSVCSSQRWFLQAEGVRVEFYKNPNPIGSHAFVNLQSESVNFTTVAVFHGMR